MAAVDRRRTAGGRRTAGELRVAGLFAGIGGLELGLTEAGHETRMLCEFDEGAQAVLRARFPGCRLEGDVRDLRSLPRDVDLVAAGFPCQNLSQAGDTAGIDGPKSSLVGEVFRLLQRRRVPWLVLENVPFMLHLDRGRAMQHVVGELQRLGYRWAYRVIDSMAFGLPQRRRRVFLVASQEGNPADVLFAEDRKSPAERTWKAGVAAGFYWTEGNRGVGWAVEAIPTLKGGSGWGIPSAPAVLCSNGDVVTPGIEDAEELQGFDRGWTNAVVGTAQERFRWRMVGNAINVRAARWLGGQLAEPGRFDEARLGQVLDGTRWPTAACDLGEGPCGVEISEWPQCRVSKGIETHLRSPRPLSARATAGFVSRAERAQRIGKLRFPAGFLEGLDRHRLAMAAEAV